MSAIQVIEEIKHLPRAEQSRVIKFAFELALEQLPKNSELLPDALGELTRRMVEEKDPAKAKRLEDEIVRGFYGDKFHA